MSISELIVEMLGLGRCRSPGDINICMGIITLGDSLGTIPLLEHPWTSSTNLTDPIDNIDKFETLHGPKLISIGHAPK